MIAIKTIWIYTCNSTVTMGVIKWSTFRYMYFEF